MAFTIQSRHVDSKNQWKPVIEAFTALFAEGLEDLAEVSVFHQGHEVLTLRGGRNGSRNIAVDDPLFVLFSSTKVLESLVVAHLVDRGLLTYDTPVAAVWPEFAQGGKGGITIAQLMRHAGGLYALDALGTNMLRQSADDLAALLASQVPLHPLDGRQVYHAFTRGFYVSEIVRRVDPAHRRLREYFDAEIARPAGLDLYIGLPTDARAADVDARVVLHTRSSLGKLIVQWLPQLVWPSWLTERLVPEWARMIPREVTYMRTMIVDASSIQARSIRYLDSGSSFLRSAADMANSREFRSVEIGSANGLGRAYSLAALGARLASDGGPVTGPLSAAGLAAALAPGESLYDEHTLCNITYTACGWGTASFLDASLPGYVGWAGAGGSVFVFHPQHRLSFAYTPSHMQARLRKVNGIALLRAVENVLGISSAASSSAASVEPDEL